jgi:hypothetical protein
VGKPGSNVILDDRRLQAKLLDFQNYYNGYRAHAGLEGRLPEPGVNEPASPKDIASYRLYHTPIAG